MKQGEEFECSVEKVLVAQGFSTDRNLRVCGREIDIYATKKDVVDIIIAIECKTNKIGIGVAEQYVQKYRTLKSECKEFNAKYIWIVSNVGFADSAMDEIANNGMFAYTYSELISKYGTPDITFNMYEDFKLELANSSSELERCKIALSGILNNVIYQKAMLLTKFNLDTLEMRKQDIDFYNTITQNMEDLISIGFLYKDGKNLKICRNFELHGKVKQGFIQHPYDTLSYETPYNFLLKIEHTDLNKDIQYIGKDAVKVLGLSFKIIKYTDHVILREFFEKCTNKRHKAHECAGNLKQLVPPYLDDQIVDSVDFCDKLAPTLDTHQRTPHT